MMRMYPVTETHSGNTFTSVTRIFMSIPQGKVRRKVKEFEGVPIFPEEAHPKRKHRWHEVLDERRRDTGFVECRCGALGIAYSRRRR